MFFSHNYILWIMNYIHILLGSCTQARIKIKTLIDYHFVFVLWLLSIFQIYLVYNHFCRQITWSVIWVASSIFSNLFKSKFRTRSEVFVHKSTTGHWSKKYVFRSYHVESIISFTIRRITHSLHVKSLFLPSRSWISVLMFFNLRIIPWLVDIHIMSRRRLSMFHCIILIRIIP